MADYYTEFSFAVKALTDDERAWLNAVIDWQRDGIDDPDIALPDEGLAEVYAEDGDREDWYRGFVAEVEPYHDRGVAPGQEDVAGYLLWVHSDESGSVDKTAEFCRLFLRRHRPDEAIGFEWSGTCSKPRLDAFGGGAAFVTADAIEFHNTWTWLGEKLREHDGQVVDSDVLARFTTADAEAILGRPLADGEASSIRKTLEHALADAFHDAIQSHA